MADLVDSAASVQKRAPPKTKKPKAPKQPKEGPPPVLFTEDNLEDLLDELTTLRGGGQRNAELMKIPRQRAKQLKEGFLAYCERNRLVPEEKKDGEQWWHREAFDKEHPDKDTSDGRKYILSAVRVRSKPKVTPELSHEAMVQFMRNNNNKLPSAEQLADEIEQLRQDRIETRIGLKWVDDSKAKTKAAEKVAKAFESVDPEDRAEVYKKSQRLANDDDGEDAAPKRLRVI
jgi:hypothetical protein